jgi:hypothetical protein
MTPTATLIERETPYALEIEIARGKINQIRNQLGDWQDNGIPLPPEFDGAVRDLSRRFGQVVIDPNSDLARQQIRAVIADAFRVAEKLAMSQADRLFTMRHARFPRLETALGCQVGSLPGTTAEPLKMATNAVCVPLTWKEIEPVESKYRWDDADKVVDWALRNGMRVSAGPLIDLSHHSLPDWLSLWEGDLPNIANFIFDYVGTAVARFRKRIRRWQIVGAANMATGLSLSEDDVLVLIARICETVLQVDPGIEIVIGLAQPWGEYLCREERTYSGFVFADTLLRGGLHLAALDLEIAVGVWPRGSYCRDAIEISRLLDHYSQLGIPIQVTLAYPSSMDDDAQAERGQRLDAGFWHGGFDPSTQADWASMVATVAASKPYLSGIHWAHLTDSLPHRFPNCGLFDRNNQPKPALERLRKLREAHLR